MATFTRQRIRIKVDTSLKGGLGAVIDVRTGEPGKFARAAGLQVEVALFDRDTLIDISNITTATLELKSGNDPDDGLAMTDTIGAAQMNRTLTLGQWQTGDADKAHFIFVFTSSETADSVFGVNPADQIEHWMVLWGFTNDDGLDRDVFGVGKIQSFDAGVSGGVVAPPASEDGITLTQLTALLNDYLKKVNGAGVTATFQSPSTGKKVKVGVDDNGDWYEETQVTT